MKRLLCLFTLGWSAWTAEPALDVLATSARNDLQAALDELAGMREQIEAERLPLARRANELEQQVLAARAELDRAQRAQENELVALNSLKTEVRTQTEQVRFADALLGEYIRAFETRIHIAEAQRYRTPIDAAKAASASGDLPPAGKLERQLGFLGTSLDRLESAMGGDSFAGRALTPRGRMENGRFALVGPAAWFASEQSEAVGVVELQLGSAEPTVIAIPAGFATGLRTVVTSGSGELPVDSSMGNAVKLGQTKESLVEHLIKGGPVMIPILLLGAVALAIFFWKWLQISRVRTAGAADLQVILGAIGQRDRTRARQHAESILGPVGEMLRAAIEHSRERKEYIEEVMYERMLSTKPRLEKLLPYLALSAAAAPLLGLLGTVTGMINTFNMITVFGTGDPRTLAGGISEALITTEFGLVVAIPSLLLHAVLSRKVRGVLGSMEQTAVAFINGLPLSPEETSKPSQDYD